MSNYSVELQQLQAMADHFITASYPYFEQFRETFKLLKLTGCRISELFEINRWSIQTGYHVTLQPQKGNNIRYLTLGPDFGHFLTAIENQTKPFLGLTVWQFWNLFNRINPYGSIYSDTKEITAYLFRYLYVRTLLEDGLTVAQIANQMGYTSEAAVHNYLDAELTSTYEVPVPVGSNFPEGAIIVIEKSTNFNGTSDYFTIPNPIISNNWSVQFKITNTEPSWRYLLSSQKFSESFRYPALRFSGSPSNLGNHLGLHSMWGYTYGQYLLWYNPTSVFDVVFVVTETLFSDQSQTTINVLIKCYVNGIPYNNVTGAGNNVYTTRAPFLFVGAFGNSNGIPTSFFLGICHELTFYNRHLTPTEIQNYFSQ